MQARQVHDDIGRQGISDDTKRSGFAHKLEGQNGNGRAPVARNSDGCVEGIFE
jgi:hypothetical protein